MPMRSFRFLTLGLLLTACASSETGSTPPPPAPLALFSNDVCSTLRTSEPGLPSIADDGDGIIRVLAFGDFGDGSEAQRATARAMVAYDRDHPFDFGLTLGDNFYNRGLNSPDHPRWESQWERLYNPLGIRLYGVLGNHDYLDSRSPAAEMKRSDLSASWCLPSSRYTFTAGPLQFFAIDTTPVEEPRRDPGGAMSSAQKSWLTRALADSTAGWKIVYGHHPVYSNGHHGEPGNGTLTRIKSYLLPVLTESGHGADVYLAGHDHDLQALEPERGVHFFVAGAASEELRPIRLNRCRLWDAERRNGFLVLEADIAHGTLSASFVGVGTAGAPYTVLHGPITITKGATSACSRP
jgi:tartrate-resistant acid phosphatase type 5